MARKGGGLRGSQVVKGGSTGAPGKSVSKPGGAPSVNQAIRASKIGGSGKTPVTGRVAKHVNKPAVRGKGTY